MYQTIVQKNINAKTNRTQRRKNSSYIWRLQNPYISNWLNNQTENHPVYRVTQQYQQPKESNHIYRILYQQHKDIYSLQGPKNQIPRPQNKSQQI